MALTDKLSAIANAIRTQSGKTAKLTLDQMPGEIIDLQSLVFTVVGGTSVPSNPKVNTIWIKTSTTITGWVFSATQPSGATGRVWIQTGNSSPVAFNALKKNNIQVYPHSAKQYVSGAWVDKEALIYQGGAWGKLIPDIVLFDSGDNTAVTGGWTAANSATMTNNTNLTISVPEGHPGSNIMANNAVDLTDYSTILVNCTSTAHTDGRGKVYVGTTFGSSAMSASVSITGTGEYAIDVSNLTGLYYIGLYTNYSDTFSVNKIIVKA